MSVKPPHDGHPFRHSGIVHLGAGFAAVDRSGSSQRFIEYLDRVRATPALAEWRRTRLVPLGLRKGSSVLDVGCGTGDDALGLAEVVGPAGRVVGVDCSKALIAEARRRAATGPTCIEFHVADAHRLDFPDASFDAVRCERTLQYVVDAHAAVREMARVTRPGGRIELTEPDWDTLVVDATDLKLTRRILAFAADTHPLGQAGRRLRTFCLAAGLVEVQVNAHTLVVTDFPQADALFELTASAARGIDTGTLSEREVRDWLADLESRARAGCFFSAVTGFTVLGVVAPSPRRLR